MPSCVSVDIEADIYTHILIYIYIERECVLVLVYQVCVRQFTVDLMFTAVPPASAL